jgi:Chaperone of endosialidase
LNLGNADVESGNQAGSNFTLGRYSDAGAWLGDAFTIRRTDALASFSTFQVGITNPAAGDVALVFAPTNGGSTIQLNKNTGSFNSIYGFINSVGRWQLSLGNANQDFEVSRFDSSGAFVGAAFTIANGNASAFFQAVVTAPSFNPTSDERIKGDIEPLAPIDFAVIKPISFVRKRDPETGRHYGFSAQNLRPVAAELVIGDFDTDAPAAIDPVGILALAVLEIQSLHQRLKAIGA